jgi:hypothetical protein
MNRVAVTRTRNGHGLVATRMFKRDATILALEGRVVHYELLWEHGGRFANNCIRFGPDTYLDPGDSIGRFVNHSCEPNAAIRKVANRLCLVAVDRIRTGGEITFDYSTTIGDDDIWTMRCNCGSRRCRKRIKRFGSLPADTRDDYVRRHMVPGYILRTLDSPR